MPNTTAARSGMHRDSHRDKLFKLRLPAKSPMGQRLSDAASGPLERLLGVSQVNDVYDAARGETNTKAFLDNVLAQLGVRWHIPADQLARIPKTGPVVVVSNHPFGGIDGILLAAILASVRPDLKVMANQILGRIPHLKDLFLFVDPFGGPDSAAANLKSVRQSIRWLEGGGMLATFPAGEVASLNLKQRRVIDPPWSDTIARIVRRTGAPVLPIFFDGRNSAAFHLAGLVHPRLRTALLARELFKKRGCRVDARIGSLVPARRLEMIEGDADLTNYLRQRTMLLKHRGGLLAKASPDRAGKRMAKVVDATDPARVAHDVANLPEESQLVKSDEYTVYIARAKQIPNVMRELGRLREITFRATGEGTGKEIDLDSFDEHYLHLFVWNNAERDVVGAYRLGQSDLLLQEHGPSGLYTSTLFDFDSRLLRQTGAALEMGRSFVRVEYQKAYAPLLLLWKGIGTFCTRNPRYKTLFGPVSISNDYQTASKELMIRFLQTHHTPMDAAELVRPRNPFRETRLPRHEDPALAAVLRDAEDVSSLVADLEPDQKGIPVLLRQYLKLGAKLMAFNVDPDFNNAVDGLIVVDLTRTEPRVLERYFGKEGYKTFMAYHRERSPVEERLVKLFGNDE